MQATVLQDAAVVGQLRVQMQALWQAEIQLRTLGLAGNVHPFDHTQLPLLSSMEFNEAPEASIHRISWPSYLHEDPASLEVAVKQALGSAKLRKALQCRHWKQLLHPGPQTWLDLEQSLARLVEQIVMQFVVAWSVNHVREGAEEPSEAGVDDAGQVLTSRAAKRLRQRERRKLCRKGVISAPTPGGGATPVGGAAPLGVLGDTALWTVEAEGAASSQQRCIGADAAGVDEAKQDDGASERSVSTATGGGRSQAAGEKRSGPEWQGSLRKADSLSEVSGQSGQHGDDLIEGGSESSNSRRRGSRLMTAGAGWLCSKAPSRHWCDVSDGEDELEDTVSTKSASRASGDGRRTPCSAGSRGPTFDALDEISLKGAFEESAGNRYFTRQASSSSDLSGFDDVPPLSRQVTGCATPKFLWPSTPELTPRLGPLDAPCLPPMALPCSAAPGIWQLA